MIGGVNKIVEYDGKEYHVQAEDMGLESASFELRVYEKGTLLWRKRVPYDEILKRGLRKIEQEEALRSLMEKSLQTLQAAIAKGRLGSPPT